MGQASQRLGLAKQPRVASFTAQELQRNRSIELRVVSAPHRAHAAAPQLVLEGEATDPYRLVGLAEELGP